MGFLDDVAADLESTSEGGDYVNGPEKRDIVAKSIPFTITGLVRGKTRYNEDAFTLNVQLAGEDRKMEFKYGSRTGEPTSRDETLQKLLDSGEVDAGPVGPVTLKTVGDNGFYVFAPVA